MFSLAQKKWIFAFIALILMASSLSACSGSSTTKTVPFDRWGTFPAPLYTQWFATYATMTGVQVNYSAVGSGAGITAITNGTVDFGASDAIMTNGQVADAEANHGPILAIPTTMGAVAITYNLPDLGTNQLKLTGDVLANIYLKTINYWDDPAIIALNPGVNFPHSPIAVVHRSDSSGTSFIFTNYLSKISPQWQGQIGYGTTVNWPGDIGGDGSAGVAAQIRATSLLNWLC